jgi:hypothetical protein
MCFSATASFVAAGLTGVAGIVSLSRVRHRSEVLLAITPIIFSVQQTIEGLLWLDLTASSGGPAATGLTLAFLIFAEVFWPVYAPLAVWLMEPEEVRGRLMLPSLAVGMSIGSYLLWLLLTGAHSAHIVDAHIVYVTGSKHPVAVAVAYVIATSLPLLLSSRPALSTLGAIVLVGCVVSYAFYWSAFVSVWCFFAAAASAVILFHFEAARRHRLFHAGT